MPHISVEDSKMMDANWSSYEQTSSQTASASTMEPPTTKEDVDQRQIASTTEQDRKMEREEREKELQKHLIRTLVDIRRRTTGPTSHLHVLRNPTPDNVRRRMETDTYYSPGLHNGSDTYARHVKSQVLNIGKSIESNDALWNRRTTGEQFALRDWFKRVTYGGRATLEWTGHCQRKTRIEQVVQICHKKFEERMSQYVFNEDGSIKGLKVNEEDDFEKEIQRLKEKRTAEGLDYPFSGVSTSEGSHQFELNRRSSISVSSKLDFFDDMNEKDEEDEEDDNPVPDFFDVEDDEDEDIDSSYAASLSQPSVFDDMDAEDEDDDDDEYWDHIYGFEDPPMHCQPKLAIEETVMDSIETDQDQSCVTPSKRSFEQSGLYDDDLNGPNQIEQSTNTLNTHSHYLAHDMDVCDDEEGVESAPDSHNPKKRRLTQDISDTFCSPIVAGDTIISLDETVYHKEIVSDDPTTHKIPGLGLIGTSMGGNDRSITSASSNDMIDPALLQMVNPHLPAIQAMHRMMFRIDNTIKSTPRYNLANFPSPPNIFNHAKITKKPQYKDHSIPQPPDNFYDSNKGQTFAKAWKRHQPSRLTGYKNTCHFFLNPVASPLALDHLSPVPIIIVTTIHGEMYEPIEEIPPIPWTPSKVEAERISYKRVNMQMRLDSYRARREPMGDRIVRERAEKWWNEVKDLAKKRREQELDDALIEQAGGLGEDDDDLADVVDRELEAEKERANWNDLQEGPAEPRKLKGNEATIWRRVRNEVMDTLDYGIGIFRLDPTGRTWR